MHPLRTHIAKQAFVYRDDIWMKKYCVIGSLLLFTEYCLPESFRHATFQTSQKTLTQSIISIIKCTQSITMTSYPEFLPRHVVNIWAIRRHLPVFYNSLTYYKCHKVICAIKTLTTPTFSSLTDSNALTEIFHILDYK